MSETALRIPAGPEADPALHPAPTPKPVAVPSERLLGVDALRGLALVLMALDHSAYYLSVNVQAEHYMDAINPFPSMGYRLIGLLTNLSAPTFWLVSGISVALLTRTLRRQGGNEWAPTKFLLIRAGFLFLLDWLVVPFLWSKRWVPTYDYSFGLLASFAVSLLLLAVLRFLRLRVILAISLASLFGYEWIASRVTPDLLREWGLGIRLWTTYGTPGHTPNHLGVTFPVLGWFGLMGCGYVLGKRLKTVDGRRPGVWAAIGVGLLATWLVVRIVNGYGNVVPRSYTHDWTEFFTMYKGPVSVAFMAFNLGFGCLAFAWLLRHGKMLVQRPWRWMVNLGQASLFVFLTHLLVYRTLARIQLKFFHEEGQLVRYMLTFVLGLVILVPVARWYSRLKRRHPGTILQYL
jgi:uncharacterized membrane protein